jgi:hypothetical protein
MKIFRLIIAILLGTLFCINLVLLYYDIERGLGEGEWLVYSFVLILLTIFFHILLIIYFLIGFKKGSDLRARVLKILGYSIYLVFIYFVGSKVASTSLFFISNIIYLVVGAYMLRSKVGKNNREG